MRVALPVSISPEQKIARAIAGVDLGEQIAPDGIILMSAKGLSHDHWRLGATGLLLRVPRLSQLGLDAETLLSYQSAAFDRALHSGHTPERIATLSPTTDLPRGALVVREIAGKAPTLPGDMSAIAHALAALHSLPVPATGDRPPLAAPSDPVRALVDRIESQLPCLNALDLPKASRAILGEEAGWARTFALDAETLPPVTTVLSDSHPGNFVIDGTGRAYAVDLEKLAYDCPAIDLAHASLGFPIRWDPDVDAVLSPHEIRAFYAQYLQLLPPVQADRLRPWLVPLRRLTWLRTTTFAAAWMARTFGGTKQEPDPEWQPDPAREDFARRARSLVDGILMPQNLEAARGEWSEQDPLRLDE